MKTTLLIRKLVPVLLVVSLLLSLVGCSKGNTTTDPAKPAGKTITIKIAHAAAESHMLHKGWLKLKEELEKRSNGQFKVQVFPNSQLGSGDRVFAEMVQNGSITITSVPTYTMATVTSTPAYNFIDLPFLLNREKVTKIMDGSIGQSLAKDALAKGIKVMGTYDIGWVDISNKKRPLKMPADFSGLKIRTTESALYMDLISALGASPTPMAFGEVYTALQQGTVDGMMTVTGLYVSQRFYEVQKYMTRTAVFPIYHVYIVNPKFYNDLTPELKKAFDEASQVMVDFNRKLTIEDEKLAITELTKKGMELHTLTPQELAAYKEKTDPVVKKHYGTIGKDFMDKYMKELNSLK